MSEAHEIVPANGQSASLMEAIVRAASDPSSDPEKAEKFLNMALQLQAKEAEKAFNVAMSAAQTGMRAIGADQSNSQTKSEYASYPQLDRIMRPIYTKHGFALSFDTGDAPSDMVRVICHVSHRDGHSRSYHVDMPADGKGAKGGDVMSRTHATGAAMTYGQRYLLKLIFNIAVGEDDDGNGASNTGPISEDQRDKILLIIGRAGFDVQKVCVALKVKDIASIQAKDYEAVVTDLNLRERQKEKMGTPK